MPRMPGQPVGPISPAAAHAAVAVSDHTDTRTAATEVADLLHDELAGRCDLALIFASFHHRAAFSDAADLLLRTLSPGALLGITGESVLGADREIEGLAGFVVMGLRMPGVRVNAWRFDNMDPWPSMDPEYIAERIGLDVQTRGVLMMGDPFTTPMTRLLPAIGGCAGPSRPLPVFGGMASGASRPGHNVVQFNDQSNASGAVGVSFAGDVAIDCVVSQGCRPIGEPMVITKASGTAVLELGGRTALEMLRETLSEFRRDDPSTPISRPLAGLVINEYKDHFGRGDFLVRNVLGFDERVGAVQVGDMPRVGQTLQFHVRDAETADEDLRLLLDGQQLKSDPYACMLFTCNGRGTRLFSEPNHDVDVLRERLGGAPIAGFFAGGEIGPVGEECFVHGHTASIALFRELHHRGAD